MVRVVLFQIIHAGEPNDIKNCGVLKNIDGSEGLRL